MFLATATSVLRVITGSAVTTIGVQSSWVDNASGTYTPGSTSAAITTATTTTIVAAPAASTIRNVKSVNITNNHATSSCVVTLEIFDGTTAYQLEKLTLRAGEVLQMTEDGQLFHLTNFGAEYEYAGPSIPNLGITGTVAETVPRNVCAETDIPTTSGSLHLVGAFLKAGQVVTNISFFSSGTAAGTPTNQFFALYGKTRMLLAQSANATTAAWAANTIKTLAMTTAYTVPVSDIYYAAVMVTATTAPSLKGTSVSGTQLGISPFAYFGLSSTGLTTALPHPCVVPTTGSAAYWAAIT